MTTQVEAATLLYAQLKPAAVRAARSYVMERTPHELQEEMAVLIDADVPPTDAPVVIDAPFVGQTGTGVGSTLNSTLGNWTGAPTSRVYQWKRGATVVGTNSPNYTVTAPDIGQSFTCTMIASNGVGASLPVVSNAVIVA
jgi:hypothetical protein